MACKAMVKPAAATLLPKLTRVNGILQPHRELARAACDSSKNCAEHALHSQMCCGDQLLHVALLMLCACCVRTSSFSTDVDATLSK